MKTAKVSDYRSHLSSFHKNVIMDHDPLLISGQEGNVVILPENDYENLVETIYILRDKTTMKSLERIREEMAQNVFSGHELEEVFPDAMES